MKAIVFINVQNDMVDGPMGSSAERQVAAKGIENLAKATRNRDGVRTFATLTTMDKSAFKDGGTPYCLAGTPGHAVYGGIARSVRCVLSVDGGGVSGLLPEAIRKTCGEVPDAISVCGFGKDVSANAASLREAFPDSEVTVIANLSPDVQSEAAAVGEGGEAKDA